MTLANWSINLFYPLILFGFLAFLTLIYLVIDKLGFIKPIFFKTIDSHEKTIDKFVDYSKSIKFTVAHEIEIHEIEAKLKEIEKKLDTICVEQKQKENINILEE